MGKLDLNVNTNNQVFVSNATLARIFLLALLIMVTFFTLQKFI